MKNLKKLSILCLMAVVSTPTLADVPQLINYQGKLTDAGGTEKTGPVNLSFDIYDGPGEGATKVWGPQSFNNVPLVEGNFNVILSSTDVDGDPVSDAFVSPNAYLQITDLGANLESDGDDAIISPRQQILSTPYTMNSSLVKGRDLAAEFDALKNRKPLVYSATFNSENNEGYNDIVHQSGDFVDSIRHDAVGYYLVSLKKDEFISPPTIVASCSHWGGVVVGTSATVENVSCHADGICSFHLMCTAPGLDSRYDSGFVKFIVHRNGEDYNAVMGLQ